MTLSAVAILTIACRPTGTRWAATAPTRRRLPAGKHAPQEGWRACHVRRSEQSSHLKRLRTRPGSPAPGDSTRIAPERAIAAIATRRCQSPGTTRGRIAHPRRAEPSAVGELIGDEVRAPDVMACRRRSPLLAMHVGCVPPPTLPSQPQPLLRPAGWLWQGPHLSVRTVGKRRVYTPLPASSARGRGERQIERGTGVC